MSEVVGHVVSGLASGAVAGLIGMALVIVRRASGVVNVAQAALATVSGFVCWTMTQHGWAFWPAFGGTIVLSFAGGAALEQTLVRPLRRRPVLSATVLCVGVLLAAQGLATWIWGTEGRRLEPPFSHASVHLLGAAVSKLDLGVAGLGIAAALLVALLVTRTRIGLGLRAAAADQSEAVRAGVPVGTLRSVAWGIAAATGAIAGVLASTRSPLEPDLLSAGLVYGLTAALLGSFRSLARTLAGGLALGVALDFAGGGLQPAIAVAVSLVALLMRWGAV
jgi:branched-chain amino acid transport system permease protein